MRLKKYLLLSGILIVFFAKAQNKVTITVASMPDAERNLPDIFLAGSFNNWNPADKKFQLQKNSEGNYAIELRLAAGIYEYKLTKGSWNTAECNSDGSDANNRVLNIEKDGTVNIDIPAWKDMFASSIVKSTAGKNVFIIDTAFFMPQLNRYRRICIYLPASYNLAKKKYPVIYMHDGQNIFDKATSFSGEWGVDECLDTLSKIAGESIVVSINNGGQYRLNEYCPYDFYMKGMESMVKDSIGQGKMYVDFIANTLKPFIDKRYRTLRKRKYTGIAGSSMGGLISLYAAIQYPKKFGSAGVFSPSLWIAPAIYNDIEKSKRKLRTKIYLQAGSKEGTQMVADMLKAFELLRKKKKIKLNVSIRAEGEHNEATWRNEFPYFYNWIMNQPIL